MNHTKAFLKTGQIVQGKIVKLYPNNKAQIQIGSQTMIAQLEASLTIGENYHFQVTSNADVTHLKVIGEQLQRNASENMHTLLQGLGMKATKANIALMQQLIKDKIPFDRNQLIAAFQLLEGAKDKGQAQLVIKEMLVHKLPFTDSIFQALFTKATNGFSEQLNSLLQQLKQDTNQTPLKESLIEHLASLTEHPNSTKGTLIKHVLSEIGSNETNFFITAKASGLVDKNVNFPTWKTDWQSFAKESFGNVPVNRITMSNEQLTSLSMPFKLNVSEVLHALEHALENKGDLIRQSQTLLGQFSAMISKANIHQTPLSENDFSELKTQIENKLLPLMSNKQQQQVRTLVQNNSTSLEQLQTILKTLANDQIYTKMGQLIKNINFEENVLVAKPHEAFRFQLKQVLQSIGLAHEYNLAHDLPEQQSTTVKSMILQLLQQGDGVTNDRAQQLLQFINGMQIQSISDTTNFLQASLQIPGEKLALNMDLQLEFEGKKTESGKIDPAYCRILFYLDLTNLKETIVDMNIQKRSVAVTVYNDNPYVLDQSLRLKPMLKEGLNNLDYHLSTITVKPLKQMDGEKNKVSKKVENNSYQGVDYRI